MDANYPRHVAITMDGNGRWAEERQLPRFAGHEAGVKSVRSVVNACLTYQIPILSLFAFSRENWQRPEEEVALLMGLFIESITMELPKLLESGVKLRFIGSHEGLPQDVIDAMHNAEQPRPSEQKLELVLAINYSGRWDLLQAAERCAREKKFPATENEFAQYLCLADLPDPDLYIRTSGEQRISNFYLWQMAYTEFYFAPMNWPEFGEVAFYESLKWYASRERRFGKTSKQIQGASSC